MEGKKSFCVQCMKAAEEEGGKQDMLWALSRVVRTDYVMDEYVYTCISNYANSRVCLINQYFNVEKKDSHLILRLALSNGGPSYSS